jgi:hypothetical protein
LKRLLFDHNRGIYTIQYDFSPQNVGCTEQHNVKIEGLQRWDFYNASLHHFLRCKHCKNLQHVVITAQKIVGLVLLLAL